MDFFREEALTAPKVSDEEARRIALDHFGLLADAKPLGSQQDCNHLVCAPHDGGPLGVLKIANPAFSATEIAAQDEAVAVIAAADPTLRLPVSLGPCVEVSTNDGPAFARVLTFLEGGTLTGPRHLAPEVVSALGDLAGRVSAALRDFTHPGLDRVLQWDPQHADRVVELLLPHLSGADRRDKVAAAVADAWATVAALAPHLPKQAVHLDITDDNVVCRERGGRRVPDGVIDFGDLTTSWAIGELAITVSSILHHDGAEPCSIVPAVLAFDRWRPLSAEEIDALWPLVVLRAATLVVSGVHQAGIDTDNDYLTSSLDREWLIFERATSVPVDVMSAVIRAALGVDRTPLALPKGSLLATPLDPGRCAVLDLSSESDAMDEGAWLTTGLANRLALAELGADRHAVVTRFGEARLSETSVLQAVSPATVATAVDVWFAQPARLVAPWHGTVSVSVPGDDEDSDQPGRLVLATSEHHLVLEWTDTVECDTDGDVDAGAPLVSLPVGAHVRIAVNCAGHDVAPFVRPEYAAGWLAVSADPLPLLGLKAVGPSDDSDLLARRNESFASVQEHYYRDPPRIERGWRHHLMDTRGRAYLDMVNNVAVLGHAHPRVAAAAARQLRRLNTNSRFNYRAVVEFTERLAALLPEPLDTVFLVNSGSEAVDLALRLAMAATGRPDIVAVREAYHGWTYASDAVSTSTADNPNALATRPGWVHTVDAPNAYRGRYRGEQASAYATDAVRAIEALAESRRPPAAFIAEAFYGNAGGMALPDGYLAQVYAAVRRHGGLAVADEIQVGYGRLGRWFWGFQQQGVVPDIVTVAKAMGNGHPLGAVITSREIAERYRTGGYFFSSTGGSPLSCVVGTAVLDALEGEQLQDNARHVGEHMISRLRALQDKHEIIGAVYGAGLYVGVEFVRSRETLEPATEETRAICDRMRELGVIIQPTSDRMCVLKIKPPLCIDLSSADYFVDMLDRVLTEGW